MPTMIVRSFVILTCFAVALAAADAHTAEFTPNPSGFEIRRGVNLSHWLSQCFGWSPRPTFITEKDLRFIKSLGYDHVRIPVDEKELWTEDGRLEETALAFLTRSLDWCAKHDLRAIVDLHTVRAHHFNAPVEGGRITLWTDVKAQDNFLELWQQLSARLARYSVSMVAYEIMNEPVASDPEDWNRLVSRTVAAIRSREPGRVLVLGSNRWQMPDTFPSLKVPEGDRNIVLSTHTYAPLIFTHYKAHWTPLKTYSGAVHYPGPPISDADFEAYADRKSPLIAERLQDARVPYDRQQLQAVLAPAIRRAHELKLQLYCGEFGCLPTVARQDRLQYYSDIVAVFEANGMAWANWDYKGDFGIVGFDRDKFANLAPDAGLIEALLHTGRPLPAYPSQD
jgi:endoglucanase